MSLSYILFLGCTIPARGRNYEMSARKVAEKLGLELVHIDDLSCCGFPVKASSSDVALALAGRNLALAEQKGLDLVTLCSACTTYMAESAHLLNENEALRARTNKELEKLGLSYGGTTNVHHFTRILYEEVGCEKIRQHLTRDLSGFGFAAHYGCHYLKPSECFGRFDSPERPHSLDDLIEVTGAHAVQYQDKMQCCGGSVMAVDEALASKIAGDKLTRLKTAGADGVISICPFCTVMYDDNQKKVQAALETEFDLPVIYLTQLLGLGMGYDKKELGLNMNKVKTKALLAQIEEGAKAES